MKRYIIEIESKNEDRLLDVVSHIETLTEESKGISSITFEPCRHNNTQFKKGYKARIIEENQNK